MMQVEEARHKVTQVERSLDSFISSPFRHRNPQREAVDAKGHIPFKGVNMSRVEDIRPQEYRESELCAPFRQTRVTGTVASNNGDRNLGMESHCRQRSLSTLSVGSSVVSSTPSGSGSDAAQSSADERKGSLGDFFFDDREGSTDLENSDDEDRFLTDEVEDKAVQDVDVSQAVNIIDITNKSRHTLFRGNLFWHLLLGYYFVHTNTSIIPLGTRLHVATANVAVVVLGPELLWLVRTAHRARTFGLLHLAMKFYTILNCRKVAAALALLSIVSFRLSLPSPSHDTLSVGHHQFTSPPLSSELPTTVTSRLLAYFRRTSSLLSRTLPIIFLSLTSVAVATTFCITCTLYPTIYHPTTLLSISLTALLLGLRIEITMAPQEPSIRDFGTDVLCAESHRTRPCNPLFGAARANSTQHNQEIKQWAIFLISSVARVLVKIVSWTFFALSATSWLLLLGDLNPERVLLWVLGKLHTHRYR